MSNARTNNQNLIDGEMKWSVKRGMVTIELVHIGDCSTERGFAQRTEPASAPAVQENIGGYTHTTDSRHAIGHDW
jgi:hypothetical protein